MCGFEEEGFLVESKGKMERVRQRNNMRGEKKDTACSGSYMIVIDVSLVRVMCVIFENGIVF